MLFRSRDQEFQPDPVQQRNPRGGRCLFLCLGQVAAGGARGGLGDGGVMGPVMPQVFGAQGRVDSNLAPQPSQIVSPSGR